MGQLTQTRVQRNPSLSAAVTRNRCTLRSEHDFKREQLSIEMLLKGLALHASSMRSTSLLIIPLFLSHNLYSEKTRPDKQQSSLRALLNRLCRMRSWNTMASSTPAGAVFGSTPKTRTGELFHWLCSAHYSVHRAPYKTI